jgi:hypothetical protein
MLFIALPRVVQSQALGHFIECVLYQWLNASHALLLRDIAVNGLLDHRDPVEDFRPRCIVDLQKLRVTGQQIATLAAFHLAHGSQQLVEMALRVDRLHQPIAFALRVLQQCHGDQHGHGQKCECRSQQDRRVRDARDVKAFEIIDRRYASHGPRHDDDTPKLKDLGMPDTISSVEKDQFRNQRCTGAFGSSLRYSSIFLTAWSFSSPAFSEAFSATSPARSLTLSKVVFSVSA